MEHAHRPRVLMGLLFFPRGGSAHVARNLAGALPGAGWDVTLVSGSQRLPGRPGDARDFFAGLDRANRYAILYRLQEARRPETRARRLEKFVAMLREGRRIHE